MHFIRRAIVERCGIRPRVEPPARHSRDGWDCWGDQLDRSPVSKPNSAQRLLFGRMRAWTKRGCGGLQRGRNPARLHRGPDLI
jgi:hypothetical protein